MRWSLVCCTLLSVLSASYASHPTESQTACTADTDCDWNVQGPWAPLVSAHCICGKRYKETEVWVTYELKWSGSGGLEDFFVETYNLIGIWKYCEQCSDPSQYKSGCGGDSAGECKDCSTGSEFSCFWDCTYVETACTLFTDTILKLCDERICLDGMFRNHCGCYPYQLCEFGFYESDAGGVDHDRTCSRNVDCRTCDQNRYLADCAGGIAGTCEYCEKCPAGKIAISQCQSGGTYQCASEELYDFQSGNLYMYANDGHYGGVELKTCTPCLENQMKTRECRESSVWDDRICVTCGGTDLGIESRCQLVNLVDPDLGPSGGTFLSLGYATCKFGTVSCTVCDTCPEGAYMPNCVGMFHSEDTAAELKCIPCGCDDNQFPDSAMCDGRGTTHNKTTDCKSCSDAGRYPANALTHALPIFDSDGLVEKDCEFTCVAGYYRSGGGCLLCNTEPCAYGFFRKTCAAGSTSDSICHFCESQECSVGQYRKLCLAGGTTDEASVCTDCTVADTCLEGFELEICDNGMRTSDAQCQSCSTAPDKATWIGQCDWMCEEGYYKDTAEALCVACTTTCTADLEVATLCPTSTQFEDARCGCGPGSHRYRSLNREFCDRCINYKFNNEISIELDNCETCPIGYQGNAEESATYCEPCLRNFFRDDSMTKCEYCDAGSGGVKGMWHCPTCATGLRATDMRLHVWLWNYGINPGWVEYDADSAPNCVENDMVYCTESSVLKWYPMDLDQTIPLNTSDHGSLIDSMRYQFNCTPCPEPTSVYIRR
jgi:hypothetical protein